MSLAAIMLTALAVAAPPAKPDTNAVIKRPGEVSVKYCLVSMIDHVRLSAQEAGPVVEMLVKEGAVVSKGDLIAQQDDRDSQIRKRAAHFEAEVAREQASSDVNVRAAEKASKVGEAEYQQSLDINKRTPGAVSESELRKLFFQYERALLQIEVAKLEMSVARLTADAKAVAVEAADVEISRRRVEAPVDGIVDRVLVHAGEWLQPGQPVAEIARVDRLRVEAFLNAYEVSPREVDGRPVTIEVPVANGRKETFTGTIDFVSSVVVADGAYRVWVEFDNAKVGKHWKVRPGLTANMTIKLEQ